MVLLTYFVLFVIFRLKVKFKVMHCPQALPLTFKYTHLIVSTPVDCQRYFYLLPLRLFTHYSAVTSVWLAADKQNYFLAAGACTVALGRDLYKGNLYYLIPGTSIRFWRSRKMMA